MAGLLDNAMNVQPTTANMPAGGSVSLAGVTGIDPATRTIDNAKETVSGQMDSLLKSDSPYITRARSSADQVSNRRGLLNSSMAAGAGEAAAIDAALPIATGDANVFGTASRDNQAARNAALAQTADAANKASMTNAAAMNDAANLKSKGDQDIALQTLRGSQEASLQSMKGAQARELAAIEANYKTLIQASDSAGKLYQQVTDAINKTMTSDLDPGAKDAFVRRQTELLRSGLGIIGRVNNLDLTSILNFGGVTS